MMWTDWLRYVLAPLVIAILGAIVATRNAKKTPHERLKNLVEIRANLPENLDSKRVVEAAIARELVDFDRRIAADQRGFWAGVRERAIQRPNVTLLRVSVIYAVTILTLYSFGFRPGRLLRPITKDLDNELLKAAILFGGALLFLIVGVVLTICTVKLLRGNREFYKLRVDRAAAELGAKLAPEHIRLLTNTRRIAEGKASERREQFEVLVPLGVLVRRDPDFFEVTPFGEDVLERVVESLPEDSTTAVEDETGREAPGSSG